MTDNTEAMELWREARKAWFSGPNVQIDPESGRAKIGDAEAAAAIIAAKLAELRAENARLRKMLVPEWFYADGYSSEDCQYSPDEVLEYLDLKPGEHVVSVNCAGPMPKIWCAVRVRTDEEMDALETDDRVAFTEHASEEEARQALKETPDAQ